MSTTTSGAPTLVDRVPASADPDALLGSFVEWVTERGLALYPAQEEAVLEVFGGANVVVGTPTGSGKSLVALAVHLAALAAGERSVYTAPVKALVSEKFFDLCRTLGPERVGMLTGDASVNPDAPVLCCTAEVLANWALREGPTTPVDHVVADEFHYYADPDRGWAWQVPLLELTHARHVLMSATLGDVATLATDLSERTGRPTAVVARGERPVPLEHEYRETPLHETIEDALARDLAPVYVVHFTQADATAHAQALTSMGLLSREERAAVGRAVDGFRFGPGFGRDLARWLRHGIGVHHAGMLPRYRLLVEKLAQSGYLRIICGTDTLGVGVNVPIRTVLLTQLCKFDGRTTRLLSARELHQIGGRAGRAGFDVRGHVWCQAPAHVIENRRAEEKAARDPKKRKKLVKKRPPRRHVHWDRGTFERLWESRPEPLESSFAVSHSMLLHLLDRPGDGCAAARRFLLDNHEPRRRQRRHVRRAIGIYRSLAAAGVVERLDEPDEQGRLVRVHADLQAEFQLNQPLSPFVLEAVEGLDPADPEYALDVLSVVEAVLEDPTVVLFAQLDRLKGETVARLKAEGVPYEERMEELERLEWPKPLEVPLREAFDRYRARHPWVAGDDVRPKSVARDLFERGLGFHEYVAHYGLKRSEGLVLRYLSDAYKALVQTVPDDAKSEELRDLEAWLRTLVRGVDASLLDEWELLRAGAPAEAVETGDADGPADVPDPADVTADERAFRVMVRNEVFRWVDLIARRRWQELAATLAAAERDDPGDGPAPEAAPAGAPEAVWSPEALEAAMAPYFAEHDAVRVDADARAPRWVRIEPGDGVWDVRQVLLDPEEWAEWALTARVDLAASAAAARPVVRLTGLGRLEGIGR